MTTTNTVSSCPLCGVPVTRPDDTPLGAGWACDGCRRRVERRPVGTSTPVNKRCPACGQTCRRLGIGYCGYAPFRCDRCERSWWSCELSGAARRLWRSDIGGWDAADRLWLDRCVGLEAAG